MLLWFAPRMRKGDEFLWLQQRAEAPAMITPRPFRVRPSWRTGLLSSLSNTSMTRKKSMGMAAMICSSSTAGTFSPRHSGVSLDGLEAGEGGGSIVQDDHQDIGLMVDRIDQGIDAGMVEGGIPAGRDTRSLTPALLTPAASAMLAPCST